MSRTVAEELVETLAQAGVHRIYGLVGDSLNPVTDALHRSGKVDWVPSATKKRRLLQPEPKRSSQASWRSAREAAARATSMS
jgi:hypothetical protein